MVCFLIFFSLSFLNLCDFKLTLDPHEELTPMLSATRPLNPDDYAELHGYADQYVDWSYSTSPNQVISVWALDALQYGIFISGIALDFWNGRNRRHGNVTTIRREI